MADEQKIEETTETAAPAAEETKAAEVVVEPVKATEIEPGMVVRVHQKIKETNTKGEERERIQYFEGTVIAVKGKDAQSRTITVRKIASGVGVERIFPLKSPAFPKFEQIKQYKVSRAKLYYVRTSKKGLKEVGAKKKAVAKKAAKK